MIQIGIRCKVHTKTKTVKTNTKLTVCYVVSLLQIRVDNGDTMRFICIVSNDVELNIEGQAIWQGPKRVLYFNERPSHNDPRYSLEKKSTTADTQYILTITDLTLDEEGEYKCQDFNQEQEIVTLFVSSTWKVLLVWAAGCAPLQPLTIHFCIKAYMENCHFRVFIMIRISQALLFLKDYVHSHQVWSCFTGGHRLDFSLADWQSKTSIVLSLVVLDTVEETR